MTIKFDAVRFTLESYVLTLPIVGLDNVTSKYIVKSIDGLGPPDLDVGLKIALDNSGKFQNVRTQNREIVALIALNPAIGSGETVADIRQAVYGLISLDKTPVTIDFMLAGAVQVTTSGWIKKFETNIFSADPQLQVTFGCLTAFLSAPALVNVTLGTLSKSNPSITNPGTAPSGFDMEFTLTAPISSFSITNQADPTQFMLITFAFLSGDKIIIDTRTGLRNVQYVRGGVTNSLLQYLSSDSTWLTLAGGVNNFFTNTGSFNWNVFKYWPLYWGV